MNTQKNGASGMRIGAAVRGGPVRRVAGVAVATALLWSGSLGLGGAALGQFEGAQADVPTAPTPLPPERQRSNLVELGIVILLGAAAIGANLIPSKRGHQD